ncbi:alanine racemase [Microbacterium halotolerans]|uniref:alanine racemase n=1 Tax=Microbacterium halotolerans TaxID=246613 RepID=UPI001F08989B|nr:alanine racemase [Microbacterium halotolerans]
MRRNPALLQQAIAFHQDGRVPPNTNVLDLDAITLNARAFNAEASRLGLTPFAMTKQIGRNPDAALAIAAGGITRFVGVDLDDCLAAHAAGLEAGHVGHLVQIPSHSAERAAELHPEYWTVFSIDKAVEAGRAALKQGRVQKVLARIHAPGDRFYPGHEGGFEASGIKQVADQLDAVAGVEFGGVVTFPATLFDSEAGKAKSTPNLATLTRALEDLRAAGRKDVQVNAPGTTSTSVLSTLAEAGATQVEPGHGLTGTTPLHAAEDQIEVPAVTYVSEVSHIHNDRAYVFGGGLYVDPVLGSTATHALVVPSGGELADAVELPVEMPAPEAIDYYATIPLEGNRIATGDTVLFGFRVQAFVTRSHTMGISGLSTNNPSLAARVPATGLSL